MGSRGGARPNTGGARDGAGRPPSPRLADTPAILAEMRGAGTWAALARRLGVSATAVHDARREGLTEGQASKWWATLRPAPIAEVTRDGAGELDEVRGTGAFHLERLDSGAVWLRLGDVVVRLYTARGARVLASVERA